MSPDKFLINARKELSRRAPSKEEVAWAQRVLKVISENETLQQAAQILGIEAPDNLKNKENWRLKKTMKALQKRASTILANIDRQAMKIKIPNTSEPLTGAAARARARKYRLAKKDENR